MQLPLRTFKTHEAKVGNTEMMLEIFCMCDVLDTFAFVESWSLIVEQAKIIFEKALLP